ncbi:GntR family transcriptional regulator [Nocardioides daejeonensis]|uniref:GntR family transcriptional regulator n=1 Tax=Nocardioides daejeonensis TaxID=1046556 RepID=UPI000D742389|nr:GntR family transcriptional regulator [Nocardioides daejeonensis]
MQAGGSGAADRAHAHLREEILQGRLEPGTMLSENELAAALSMSRTPVRAALTRLQDEGWVTIYPKRGALVRELTEEELRESSQVRHALESAGIQRSTPERRADLADQLATNVHEQDAALAAGDFAAFTTLAMRFHRTFVEMAGNSIMLEIYDRLQDRQYLSIVRSAGRISEDPTQTLAEHRTLLEDARRGDWSAFATHLRDHQDRSHGAESVLPVARR